MSNCRNFAPPFNHFARINNDKVKSAGADDAVGWKNPSEWGRFRFFNSHLFSVENQQIIAADWYIAGHPIGTNHPTEKVSGYSYQSYVWFSETPSRLDHTIPGVCTFLF